MSASDYGPSLSDQGYSIDDTPIGNCADCGRQLDQGDYRYGWAVDCGDGAMRCQRCAAEPGKWHECPDCGAVVDQRCPCADEEPPF